MARTNTVTKRVATRRTHEGAPARKITAYQELRRSLMACMLWEDTFYESGIDIAERISDLSQQVTPDEVAALAMEARHEQNLRHAPLWLLCGLLRHPQAQGAMVGDAIGSVISRADEMGELVSMYLKQATSHTWPKQLKRGLSLAFNKFDGYQLAKYNRAGDGVRLKDVLFMAHCKPRDEQRAELWKQLVDDTLPSPETWENRLSRGDDKKTSFSELLSEGKLGYMALLRNLRNMLESGVDVELIKRELRRDTPGRRRVLPFRFYSAARHAPQLEPVLDECMQATLAQMPRMQGKTNVLVDISGSMTWANVSKRSELKRSEGAAVVAAMVRGICDDCRVFAFHDSSHEIPARHGMALVDAILTAGSGGTRLGKAVSDRDDGSRLIVITDEQSHDTVPNPKGRGYMLNVAPYKNGVGYGPWLRVDGWSENTIRYIQELEAT